MARALARLWTSFRALAIWVQLTIAFFAAVILVTPFTSEETIVADRSPATTVGPTTTREVIQEVVTTIAVTTTVAPTTTSSVPAGVPAGDDTSVVRVIDGDTIEVSGGTRVRFIGIDTPETSTGPDCSGAEATNKTRELLPPGQRIRLVYDVERLDRYGRTFVNRTLAADGFAVQATFPPNVAHVEEFRAAVAQARSANLGLWAACQPPNTAAAPTTRATVARPAAAAPSGNCHPSYSGACVPTGFSDVDCAGGSGNGPGYVSGKDFRVVGPDVYGLDANRDGIACESR